MNHRSSTILRLLKMSTIVFLLLLPAKVFSGDGSTRKAEVNIKAIDVESIGDWEKSRGVTLHLNPTDKDCVEGHLGAVDAVIEAQHTGDSVAIRISWPDASKSDSHNSKIWDEELKGYKSDEDREDRVALMFDMGGDFSACMLAGNVYQTDVWHWKAARTGPAGLAHDKHHIYSLNPVHKKSKEFTNSKGQVVYIARISDAGDEIYTANKPKTKTRDRLPGSLLNPKATGSIADVKATATHDGKGWTVTLTRKLDTGNKDDVAFVKGKSYKAAVACFDRSGDMHHSTAGFTLVIE